MSSIAAIKEEQELPGSIIALEGDSEIITTQLRLLPPSAKILVLPPFISTISSITTTTPIETSDDSSVRARFDARTYIHSVHTALLRRKQIAEEFLKAGYSPSSCLQQFLGAHPSSQPRLVFMNGGTVCASSIC